MVGVEDFLVIEILKVCCTCPLPLVFFFYIYVYTWEPIVCFSSQVYPWIYHSLSFYYLYTFLILCSVYVKVLFGFHSSDLLTMRFYSLVKLK